MASHRKPRAGILQAASSHRAAVGLTTAALASATLLSQNAQATPSKPEQSLEDVQKKVDDLYRQAGVATQQFNAAKERTQQQRVKVDRMLDNVAQRTDKLNEARRTLGEYAAAQYRSGGMPPTATLLLADDPQSYFDQDHLMERMTGRQKQAVADYRSEAKQAAEERAKATQSLANLTASQQRLQSSKQSVQDKLAEARDLLSKLTAEQKARLAAIERQKREAAERRAAELARQQAEKQRQEELARQEQQAQQDASGSTSGSGTTGSTPAPDSYATQAAKAIAFARAQIGKPYVWGATGPNSYDCSGLTQAAWGAAGVSLPRTTWDQVKVGTRVSTQDLQPGDLVFFYDDISHVGLYIGNGQMIHAPHPGANVRIESIYYMPIYGAVRPA